MKPIFLAIIQDQYPENPLLLGNQERQVYEALHFSRRRHEWWLGRMAARKLILAVDKERSGGAQVLNDPSGAPYWLDAHQNRVPGSLSISHRKDWACAAWSAWDEVGVDMELLEPRLPGFREEYCSAQENQWLSALSGEQEMVATNLTWSIKESVLKAMRIGLRIDTRRIEVSRVDELGGDEWARVQVKAPQPVSAWWRRWEDYVLTLALLRDPQPGDLTEIVLVR